MYKKIRAVQTCVVQMSAVSSNIVLDPFVFISLSLAQVNL